MTTPKEKRSFDEVARDAAEKYAEERAGEYVGNATIRDAFLAGYARGQAEMLAAVIKELCDCNEPETADWLERKFSREGAK